MIDAEETRKNFENWYRPFFKKIIEDEKHAPTFISINYDVLIDLAIYTIYNGKMPNYGLDLLNQDRKCETSETMLLKPRGSLNFLECCKCSKIFASLFALQEDEDLKCKECNNSKLSTLILPPHVHNYDKNGYYSTIHGKISEVISKATDILIIGYFLPDYDVDILHAFLKGAMSNKNRERLNVEIIDHQDPIASEDKKKKQEQEMKNKYGAIFNQSVRYYGEGFKKYAMEKLATIYVRKE